MSANVFWLTEEQFAKIEPFFCRGTLAARNALTIAGSSAASCMF